MCYVEEAIQETPFTGGDLRGLSSMIEDAHKAEVDERLDEVKTRVEELQNELLASRVQGVDTARTESTGSVHMPKVVYSNWRTKKVHRTAGLADRPAHTWTTVCGWAWTTACKACTLDEGQELPAKAVLCRDCRPALEELYEADPNRWPSEFKRSLWPSETANSENAC